MRALLAFALLASAAAPQDAGVTVSVESTLDLDIKVEDGNGESTRLLTLVRKEKFHQQVLEASAEGHAVKFLVLCQSSTLQKSGSNQPLSDPEPTPLSGNAYTVARSDKGWIVKDDKGGEPPAEGRGLGAWNEAARLLPREGPTAGQKWNVAASEVANLVLSIPVTQAQGTIGCVCESVDDQKAVILFTGRLQGKGKDDSSTKLSITAGKCVFDLAKGRPVSLSVAGAVESTRDVVDLFRKPGGFEDEKRTVGKITAKSRKLEVSFTFE